MSKQEEVKKILDKPESWQKQRVGYGDTFVDEYALKHPQVEKEICQLFTPPTDEGLREKVAQEVAIILYGDTDILKRECLYKEQYYKVADSILNIIKEAGYVKLRKGEYISGVGAINIKEPFCGIADGDDED